MAPSPERVPEEMNRFIEWVNKEDGTDDVIKAAIAHLWFVLIHPFEDGNGRITRAITEMLLARSEHTSERFYSLSNEIKNQQKLYYEVLERVGKGDGDITEWLIFFLDCMNEALSNNGSSTSIILARVRFWQENDDLKINRRQHRMIKLLIAGPNRISPSEWAKVSKCSMETAEQDIQKLVTERVMKKTSA